MKAKLVKVFAVTAALSLSLTGCVKSGGGSSSPPGAATTAPAGSAGSAGASGGAASAGGGGAGCATGPVKVGYIPKLGTDPYMTTVRAGAMDAAKELGGSVVYTEPSEATGAAQIPFVNQLVSQGVGAIAISGSDLNGAAAALKAAQAKGIKVISFDSDVAPEARSLFINQADTGELGQRMLDSMAGLINNEGEFAVLSSTQTAVNQNAWIADMKKRLSSDSKFAKMKLVTIAYGEEKADINAQKAKELVQTYPNLKGIIVPAGIGLPAAAAALQQSGSLGKVKITGLAPALDHQELHQVRQRARHLVERHRPRLPVLLRRPGRGPVQGQDGGRIHADRGTAQGLQDRRKRRDHPRALNHRHPVQRRPVQVLTCDPRWGLRTGAKPPPFMQSNERADPCAPARRAATDRRRLSHRPTRNCWPGAS